MSVKVMGRVWDMELPPNHKLVLLAYADAAEHDGTQSYPGWERLVAMTGYSRAQVARITAELIETKRLTQVKRGFTGQRAEFAIPLGTVTQTETQSEPESVASEPESVAPMRHLPSSTPVHTSPNGDGLFEAFYEFWTRQRYEPGTQLTRNERGRLNTAVKEARLADITAEEVIARGKRYRQTWRDIEATPQALLANWHRFQPGGSVTECNECSNRGVVWFNPDGERVSWDAADAANAAKCPECAA